MQCIGLRHSAEATYFILKPKLKQRSSIGPCTTSNPVFLGGKTETEKLYHFLADKFHTGGLKHYHKYLLANNKETNILSTHLNRVTWFSGHDNAVGMLYIIIYVIVHVTVIVQSAWWLLMAWCLFGTRTSATIMLMWISQCNSGVVQSDMHNTLISINLLQIFGTVCAYFYESLSQSR